MENDIKILVALISLLSAAFSTLITQVILSRKFKKTIQENYKQKFFEKQFEAYQKFWAKLRPLSNFNNSKSILVNKYSKGKDINWKLDTEIALEFCEDITSFFFSENGILLGKDTRKAMFKIRDSLKKEIYRGKNTKLIDINNETYKKIYAQIHGLFKQTRKEIGLINLKFDFDDLGISDN